MTVLAAAMDTLPRIQPMLVMGTAAAVRGLTVFVDDLPLPIGSLVSIHPPGWSPRGRRAPEGVVPSELALGEVVGFTREQAIVMLLGQTTGLSPGDRVVGREVAPTASVGAAMLGRCMNGLGKPIDGKGPIEQTVRRLLSPEPIPAMRRRLITEPMRTGVRAIDLMTPLGRGQRIGIFAGPGVGKSTLLGTIATRASSDVNVIALIGERGREVKDFLEHSLGPQGLARSVVVVATGDESPLLRLRAAKVACAAAEYFRDQGQSVLLMMDSVTRFAHAQRQVGLSVGEPPATKGYTPSVFANMALLLERAGAVEPAAGAQGGGSITGLYTILVEGDDMTEPVSDAARGILDGHVMLSRALAQKAHYPAIDVLDSVSRVANDVSDAEHIKARQQIARLLALYREVEDLVQIGAYAKGVNPETDVAIELNGAITALLRQGAGEAQPFEHSRAALLKIASQSIEMTEKLRRAKGR